MCGPSAPAPPDPRETSAASTSTNVGTAISNAYLGNVNQNTPDGSLNYAQTGTHSWRDPYTGKSYDIPTFTATQTLSEAGQGIHDTNLATQQNIANIGRDQSARIGTLLGTPLDLSSTAIEDHLFDLAQSRLQPMLDARNAKQEASYLDRGIRPGSDAYDRGHAVQTQGENDLYTSLFLNGRGQAVQEMMGGRNQSINEITALLSGSQVNQPNFINPNMPTIPTTDTAGIINNEYGQRMNIWGQQEASRQNLMGGLFGLGAAALM